MPGLTVIVLLKMMMEHDDDNDKNTMANDGMLEHIDAE